MKVKDLTVNERPREKAIAEGISSLSNRELIALLLGSGGKRNSVLEMADQILNLYPTLAELSCVDVKELMCIPGIKKAKGIHMMACFELSRRISRDEIKQMMVIDRPRCFKGLDEQTHWI